MPTSRNRINNGSQYWKDQISRELSSSSNYPETMVAAVAQKKQSEK
jgi:hypothetical protein